MKRLIFLVLIVIGLNSYSQDKGEIGLSFGMGESNLLQFVQLEGAGSSTGLEFYSLSLKYLKPINTWLSFQTGLDFGYHNFLHKGAVDPNHQFEPVREKAFLTSIPFVLRATFLKHFFFSSGILLDMDFNNADYIDNQTGIGAQVGFGAHYRFKQGFGIYVNPTISLHSMVPFSVSNYHERILESGFRFGVTYKL
jgi:hypothetical protein